MLVDPDAIEGGEEGVINWAVFMGEGAPRFILSMNPEQTTPEYAMFIINATSREVIDELVPKLRRFCFDSFPDLKAQIHPLPLGPPITNPIEIRISGRDEDEIFAIVDTVKAELYSLSGPTGISDDWGARAKKLMVQINEARAQRAGVSNFDIAISLQTALTGFETTDFREDDKVIPGHSAIGGRGPQRSRQVGEPQRVLPGDRPVGATRTGRRYRGGLGAGQHPPPRTASRR